MSQAHEKPPSVVRLREKGQLTVSAEHRPDDTLAAITSRLESAMRAAGLTVADLLETADQVRADMFRREFGDKDVR